MKILVFDNYDSFTYNLVHLIKGLGYENVEVFRNDKIDLKGIEKYDKILLSPGPGIPSEAGILTEVLKTYSPTKSIFGVCLGMQAIGEVFGGRLINLKEVYHGVSTCINVLRKDHYIFKNIPDHFNVGRYHSWAVDNNNFPKELEITGIDENGCIMSLKHRIYDVSGVQYHPESILTENGEQIIKNWLEH
ncbi:MAG: aminodeoxychorismate/anthranilate synthase component II [Bacteroidota bacterium]|nr:aminodeoxychorismate/anthranilate synthase component II [Bacteroidota bacterium]